MAATKTIFMTGATGYIGGAVLASLLERPDAQTFKIKALVRDAEKAKKLKEFGVETVVGSLDDVDLVEQEASEVDIVMAMADADHVASCQAILRGTKKHFEQTGVRTIYIHTSGMMTVADNARGLHANDAVWDDADADGLAALPFTQMHRPVDVTVVAGDVAGYVYTYIVLPGVLWGHAEHALATAGIAHRDSIVLPLFSKIAVARGRAGAVGAGANIHACIELGEQVDMYLRLLDAALRDPTAVPHGREGYYFGVSDEVSYYQITRAIGEAMVKLGRARDPAPAPLTKEEIDKYLWGTELLGANARCKATTAKALGWKPSKTTNDMLGTVEREVKALI
ncbi:hypothetical protein BD626DRAFT_553998 [Schizophyllum amplum]|uniref:NmrA-like domain-containing protein n=1 Tax=Schizophyllum amplum TaxID=97359 RepID=A0A550CXU2_9AGAR|nr:hypothetical protein BD626DRAFT_553998 [Auriculariopsis ampla]